MHTNQLSSVYQYFTMVGMDRTLGQLIREWRERSGMSLAQAAALVGIGRGHLSQFETGKIGLPQTDVRRRLAQVLGISHIELLIAAGELSEDEVTAAGVVGKVERRPDDPRHVLHELVDQINWERDPTNLANVLGLLRLILDREDAKGGSGLPASAGNLLSE
jgi:transcriptional regulator with XRE-family HTH domain